MLRILVFDEHSVYRCGLRSFIGAKVPRAVVIEASSLIEALSQIRNGTFDLVLAGVNPSSFGPLDPLKAARETSPATRFSVISWSDTPADILTSLAAGFHGFISKRQSDSDILAAITDILSGRIYVPRSFADVRGGRLSGEAVPMLSSKADVLNLTKRQREVLSLLARGKSNKEIARTLDIAEATTKIHTAALLRVLGVRNRTEAAYKAGRLVNWQELPAPLRPIAKASAARDELPPQILEMTRASDAADPGRPFGPQSKPIQEPILEAEPSAKQRDQLIAELEAPRHNGRPSRVGARKSN